MSIPLTGVAGYFTREGAFIGEYNRVAALYGSALTAGFQSIWGQFASSDQAAVQGLPDAVAAYRNTGLGYQNTLVSEGTQSSLLQVSDYTSVIPYTLARSITIVAGQMVDDGDSINKPTVTAAVTPSGDNLGDATVCVSTTNQYGDQLDMVFGETVTIRCTNSATAYAETMQAVGETSQPVNSYLWPAGSGASTTFSITDPTQNGIVTDGGFENWGGTGNNTPTNWDILNGSAGVTVFRASGGVRGAYAAQITSDGSSKTQLGQDITLSINTAYAVTVQAKVSGADGSGVFRMALTDDNGTVLQDDAGNNLSYTRNLSAQVTTSYQCFTAFFSTPRQLPTTMQVAYGFSTAPANGISLFLDLAAVVAGTQLYNGGPFVAGFSGADRTALDDYYDLAVANSLGSNSFARGFDRLYDMRGLGVYFPSSNSPTIPDALVLN
jgi:hypothetical protein